MIKETKETIRWNLNGDAQKDKDAKPDTEDKKGGVATTGGMLCPRDCDCIPGILMTSYRRAQRGGPATQERS